MTAYLRFRLPQDDEEYRLASHAAHYAGAIEDITQEVRQKVKYRDLAPAEAKVWNEVYEMVWRIRADHEVEE